MADSQTSEDRWEKLSPEKKALLAERLRRLGTGKDDHIPRRRGEYPARLSSSQQRLWLLDRMDPGGISYNVPFAYRMEGRLNIGALGAAITEIVARHDILRTTFDTDGDLPVSRVSSNTGIDIPEIEIPGSTDAEREAAVRDHAGAHARWIFDLHKGPLLRASILTISPTRHVFLMTVHHIVFDGWSERVFFGELRSLYAAFDANQPVSLPPLALQYADFAEWQRNKLEGEGFLRQLSYWRDALAGVPPLLEIPADRPRPTRQTFRGVVRLFKLSPELKDGLVRLGQAEGATLFMTVLAAFDVFLARYSGRTDIVVGTPTAGRLHPDVEPLIGFFVNTLVLRTDLSGDPTFREVIRRAKTTSLEAFDHQEVPFERIVQELRPLRNLAYGPLVQALLVLQTASEDEPGLPGLTISRLERATESAKFDLTLSLTGRFDGLEGWLDGNADIFDSATMFRMVGHFEMLLRGVVSDADTRVSMLPMLPSVERECVLEEWGRSGGSYPRGEGIVRVFAEEARSHPESTALACGLGTLSYGELQGRSAQLGWFLGSRGVVGGSVVGLMVERSFDLIVGMLGILKAGGAYLPLEGSTPDARLEYMVREARVTTVVTMASQASRLSFPGVTVVCLDSAQEEIGREANTDPSVEVTGRSLAYAMYTSGSTGRPKCVGVPHDAVVRLVRGVSYVHLGREEVLLQYAPASFDASTFEIWGALLNGGKLVLMPAGRYSLEEVGEVVRSAGVTTLWLTAALFHHMVDGPLELFGGVRQLLAGGDVLSVGHVQKFARRYPQCAVINGYGPTENTTFTCCYTVEDAEALGMSVPIGRPINNTYVYILDAHLQLVPVGVPGELYIGGDGLATGYLHQPDLTGERFVADPYRPGERMYRSGDRVRYLADGNIEFLGRMDGQIKLRGYRIEPGEIETVLAEHATVQESLVLVRESETREKSLVAYMTPRPGTTIVQAAVVEYLRSRLPDYMIPSAWVVLDVFPVTPNGKIDRNALPAPLAPPAEPKVHGGGSDEVASMTEESIARIWERVLPGGRIDRTKSFFEQGGHSLLAIRLVSLIHQTFEVRLPLAVLFENPTIPSLARYVEEMVTAEIEKLDGEADGPAGGTS